MSKKYRNLIGQITAHENMRAAYKETVKGKRFRPGALSFKEYSEVNLAVLARQISDGSYRPSPASQFTVLEPKPRLITALQFHDRIVQHALYGVINPIFEKTLLPRTYACRAGLGTHAGVRDLQAEIRRLGGPLYCLKTDFSRFFASIDLAVTHKLIRRKISCEATMRLITSLVPAMGIGLPIGSLTSQLFANVYAGALDRFLQQDLLERHWYRYMDDIVILGRSMEHLHRVKDAIEQFSRDHLGLRFSRWSVAPVSRGINFLGYRIWPDHKLLRRQSVIRAQRKIRRFRAAGDDVSLSKFVAAWTGHARWADAHNLMRKLELEQL